MLINTRSVDRGLWRTSKMPAQREWEVSESCGEEVAQWPVCWHLVCGLNWMPESEKKISPLLYYLFKNMLILWITIGRNAFCSIKHVRWSEKVTSKHLFLKCKCKTIIDTRYSTQTCWGETLYMEGSVCFMDPLLKSVLGRKKVLQPVEFQLCKSW